MEQLYNKLCNETADMLIFLAELSEKEPNTEPLKDFMNGLRYYNTVIEEKNRVPQRKPHKDYYEFVRTKLLELRTTTPGLTSLDYLNMAIEAEKSQFQQE